MLLAIDTATRFLSAALHDGTRILAEKSLSSDNQHTVQLTPMVVQLLEEIGHTVKSLSLVAVSQGPGSFSGLRVGIGMAKGLAAGCNIPLIGIPTLDVVAYATPPLKDRMLAVVRAGRGRIIAGKYHRQGDSWQQDNPPEITTWEKVVSELDFDTLVNGEIDAVELLKNFSVMGAAWQVRRAGFLADFAWKKFRDGAITGEVKPIYLKAP